MLILGVLGVAGLFVAVPFDDERGNELPQLLGFHRDFIVSEHDKRNPRSLEGVFFLLVGFCSVRSAVFAPVQFDGQHDAGVLPAQQEIDALSSDLIQLLVSPGSEAVDVEDLGQAHLSEHKEARRSVDQLPVEGDLFRCEEPELITVFQSRFFGEKGWRAFRGCFRRSCLPRLASFGSECEQDDGHDSSEQEEGCHRRSFVVSPTSL